MVKEINGNCVILNHPPLNIPTIGLRVGSLSNSLTTRRKIPKCHMDKHEILSLSKSPYFDGTNYAFWKIIMKLYLQSLGYDVWESIKNGYETSTNTFFDIGAKKLSDNNAKP
jgi:hypothetical protein